MIKLRYVNQDDVFVPSYRDLSWYSDEYVLEAEPYSGGWSGPPNLVLKCDCGYEIMVSVKEGESYNTRHCPKCGAESFSVRLTEGNIGLIADVTARLQPEIGETLTAEQVNNALEA